MFMNVKLVSFRGLAICYHTMLSSVPVGSQFLLCPGKGISRKGNAQ